MASLGSGRTPGEITDELRHLPATVGTLKRQPPAVFADSATFVYVDDPTANPPDFGVIVVLMVDPANDAAAKVDEIRYRRWGGDELQTITDRSAGNTAEPAFVDFWRIFPPGQFAIADKPIHFRIWYRSGAEHAFQIIGSTSATRAALTDALIAALQPA